MSTIIRGTEFSYRIDTEHGVNHDGFIAEGTESIVFKGIKFGGDLRYSCALKFKPKYRLADFMEREYKIIESLQTCRSVVRVLDVIEDLGDFSVPYRGGEISAENCFCVVEEFIDGESLQDYCIHRWFTYDNEKRRWARNNRPYDYREIVTFQNQLVQFMINLCEIMKFVSNTNEDSGKTDPNKPIILHCDIKPENIMVTKHGKELVLIDFGRSQDLVDRRVYQHYNDQVRKRFMADYTDRQWQDIGKDNFYSYGTVGYTAPECYAQAENGLYPFINQIGALQYGSISIESDIFGFGATFWECFYSYELCRKAFESVEEATDPSFFNKAITKYYEDRIHQEQVLDYCDRDFRDVDIAFHESIEAILKKCTRTREQGFQEPAKTPNTYYHNFAVLQNDVERARDAIPSLDRKSDPLVRQMIGVAGFCGAAMACFLVLFILLEVFANVFAWDKWGRLTNSYTENQIAMLIDISEEMMKVPLEKTRQENLNEIVRFMHGGAPNDDVIDQEEASLVTGLLQKHFRNQSTWGPYLDEVMQYARSDNMDAVAKSVYRINLKDEQSSEGYRLAKAIAQVNDADDGDAEVLISAYRTATEMAGKPQYQRAVSKLAGKLLTGKKVDTIAAGLQTNRSDIREQLNAIER